MSNAFWAAGICSTVWAASDQPNAGLISLGWFVFAIVMYFAETRGQEKASGTADKQNG